MFVKIGRTRRPTKCTVGQCNPLPLHPQDRSHSSWLTGGTWGIQFYLTGYDTGNLFTIQKTPNPQEKWPIGPIAELKLPIPTAPPKPPVLTHLEQQPKAANPAPSEVPLLSLSTAMPPTQFSTP